MTNYYLNKMPDHGIAAWVAIGHTGTYTDPGTIGVPVLDIFGEKGALAVRDTATQRASTLRSLRGSAQIEVSGADHFFTGRESELVRQVQLFLDRRLK